MPLRRSHKKSHHGCTQCKQRRIKCDEARPSCGSCRKKRVACTFLSHAPVPLNPLQQHSTQLDGPRSGVQSTIPLLELELLHHWHTATAASLAHSNSIQELFRITFPEVALSYPFLMHSLLAVSALHIRHKCSTERRRIYTEAAIKHNDLSVSLCTPLLSNMTSENCHALFAFSCLVAVFAYAAQDPTATCHALDIGDVVKVFKLVRGAGSIVVQARPWIQQGEMRPLLSLGHRLRQPSGAKYAHELYARLEELFQQHTYSVLPASPTSALLSESFQHLLSVLKRGAAQEDTSPIMAWPVLVDAKYLDLLQEGEPTSFVILGYYGAALELLRDEWWLEGWGESLMCLSLKTLGVANDWKMVRCLELIRKHRASRSLIT
ncbi:hypothetical protein BDV23DRAFT_193301 [Aspergillus alliaceus]|uniref:Zn(2)-C6 fungal-type domain-containing protein n=1 Tax=Petromyces alliaceus TaxID=209559 RepID=A0A5N7CAT6_PETAA|nr:hypothetical protein BDV23DRAFT_193301 [Aspergillus alliaceus]